MSQSLHLVCLNQTAAQTVEQHVHLKIMANLIQETFVVGLSGS